MADHKPDPSMFLLQEPVQIFDELYFIGNRMVGIYIIKTSEGLVLIESMETLDADDEFLQPSLEKLGLQDEKILIIFLTHGHFDHYMGSYAIQQRTGCKVALSREDAGYMSWSVENQEPGRPLQLPRINQVVKDGDELTFGDFTMYVMSAPGHTPGCLNYSFDVHDHGEKHRVIMFGGYGVFGPGNYPDNNHVYPYGLQWAVDQALTFASTCVKTWEYCKANHVDVYFNPHPHLCDLHQHAEENRNRSEGDSNAFVIGTEEVRKWILDRFQVCMSSVERFTDLNEEYQGS